METNSLGIVAEVYWLIPILILNAQAKPAYHLENIMITVDQALNRKRTNMHAVILGCAAWHYAHNRREIRTHLDDIEVALDNPDLSMDCEEVLMDEYDHYEWLMDEWYVEQHGYEMYKGIRNDVAQALGCITDPSFHAVFNWIMANKTV